MGFTGGGFAGLILGGRERSTGMDLRSILASVSQAEARAVYDALAQWADNARCGLEEVDGASATDVARIEAVEAVVARLEGELVKLAG